MQRRLAMCPLLIELIDSTSTIAPHRWPDSSSMLERFAVRLSLRMRPRVVVVRERQVAPLDRNEISDFNLNIPRYEGV